MLAGHCIGCPTLSPPASLTQAQPTCSRVLCPGCHPGPAHVPSSDRHTLPFCTGWVDLLEKAFSATTHVTLPEATDHLRRAAHDHWAHLVQVWVEAHPAAAGCEELHLCLPNVGPRIHECWVRGRAELRGVHAKALQIAA